MRQCVRWEDANYSGRKIRSLAPHTIRGGLPNLCVALRISELEQCSLQTGYWPSLEVSAANYENFLSGGGDADKTSSLLSLFVDHVNPLDQEIEREKIIIIVILANSVKLPEDLLRGTKTSP